MLSFGALVMSQLGGTVDHTTSIASSQGAVVRSFGGDTKPGPIGCSSSVPTHGYSGPLLSDHLRLGHEQIMACLV